MPCIAYICEPQNGGTYTSFRRVRERLLSIGMDYRCVPPFDRKQFEGGRFIHDEGVDFLEYPDPDPAGMARRLVRHLLEGGFAAVVLLPGCYPWVSSLPPYLPRGIRCLVRMPHNARGVYWPTALMEGHLNRIIAVGPRLKQDLVSRYGVAEAKVCVIPNGVDVQKMTPGEEASPRRAVFVGRLEDVQKNILLLPRILSRALMHDAAARLTVVGSGPDAARLDAGFRSAGVEGHVDVLGRVASEEVQGILRTHGVFLLPSRYEGSSNSTLEAMTCGCVPVLSRLPGITDEMVVDGESGCLFSPHDWKGMGDAWGRMIQNEADWVKMRSASRERVVSAFSLARMGEAYAGLFREIISEPDSRLPAKPLDEFILEPRLGPTWRRWVPDELKKRLRTWAARLGMSP